MSISWKLLQNKKRPHNSTYKKLAVQWLDEALCFVSSSVVADFNSSLKSANFYVQTVLRHALATCKFETNYKNCEAIMNTNKNNKGVNK